LGGERKDRNAGGRRRLMAQRHVSAGNLYLLGHTRPGNKSTLLLCNISRLTENHIPAKHP
jgi:hypothetical protein